jgi:hypothetical protein
MSWDPEEVPGQRRRPGFGDQPDGPPPRRVLPRPVPAARPAVLLAELLAEPACLGDHFGDVAGLLVDPARPRAGRRGLAKSSLFWVAVCLRRLLAGGAGLRDGPRLGSGGGLARGGSCLPSHRPPSGLSHRPKGALSRRSRRSHHRLVFRVAWPGPPCTGVIRLRQVDGMADSTQGVIWAHAQHFLGGCSLSGFDRTHTTLPAPARWPGASLADLIVRNQSQRALGHPRIPIGPRTPPSCSTPAAQPARPSPVR